MLYYNILCVFMYNNNKEYFIDNTVIVRLLFLSKGLSI